MIDDIIVINTNDPNGYDIGYFTWVQNQHCIIIDNYINADSSDFTHTIKLKVIA